VKRRDPALCPAEKRNALGGGRRLLFLYSKHHSVLEVKGRP
jgi:hypothetical protein